MVAALGVECIGVSGPWLYCLVLLQRSLNRADLFLRIILDVMQEPDTAALLLLGLRLFVHASAQRM